jgi:hypothetical protein
MFALTILIPVVSNDGAVFTAEDHAAFEAFTIDRFGGITLIQTTAVGAWLDAGKLYRDETRVYEVAVASITKGHLVAEVVEFAKAHYSQLAIYVRYLGIVEIL